MFPQMTPAQVFTRSLALTYNPNRRRPKSAATATPAADPVQKERDWFWNELLRECTSKKHVRQSWIALMLQESGRSQTDLDAALDAIYAEQADADAAENPAQSTPTTSSAAKVCPPVTKESPMSEQEKQTVKSQWDAKMNEKADAHPHWSTSAILSQVARENPELRKRYVASANSR